MVAALERDPRQIAVELVPGAKAHALVTKQSGKERRSIEDVVQVSVIEAHIDGRHNIYRVAVESDRYPPGVVLEVRRADLYARDARPEQVALARLVRFVWGARYRGQQSYNGGRS